MGFIKGTLLLILTFIIFLLLLITFTFASLTFSLSYENVQENSKNLVKDIADKEILKYNVSYEIDNYINQFKSYCQQNPNVQEYVVSFENSTIKISCSSISQPKEEIINNVVESFVYGFYFKKYECGFFDCFSKEKIPLFLISKKAKDYFRDKFYLTLGIALILAAISYVFLENKINWPIFAGFLIIISAFVFKIILGVVFSIFKEPYSLFLGILLNKAGSVFWFSLITGFLFLSSGLIIKMIVFRYSLKDFLSRFSKQKIKQQPKTRNTQK
ncbi:MAG: hypothetical protein KatS3mg001_113 [Candidatus Pacearchaeota archaeon]|nr:MAG: hypothetical protein KatS3mg001_113 [Candidatus Pacearchaeota archaeon]